MDQTKFINSYIANLAERLKALTLDNIMLNTQLSMANENANELMQKIQGLENTQGVPVSKSDYAEVDGNLKSDYKYTDDTSLPNVADTVEQNLEGNLDVNNSPGKTK